MTNKLSIRIGGKDEDIDALSFLGVVTETVRLLQDLDSEMSGGSPSLSWFLSGASKNSPVQCDFAGRTKRGNHASHGVTDEFLASMEALETGSRRPRFFTDSMLDRAKRIASPVSTKISSLVYFGDHHIKPLSVSLQLAANADKFHMPDRYSEYSELEGYLGQLTAHDEHYEFCIFDSLTNNAIKCEFDPADFESVRDAMRTKVVVSGLVTYKRKDHSPVLVKVDDWRPLPTSVPIESLHALNINLTRGRPSEDVIRALRAFDA